MITSLVRGISDPSHTCIVGEHARSAQELRDLLCALCLCRMSDDEVVAATKYATVASIEYISSVQ